MKRFSILILILFCCTSYAQQKWFNGSLYTNSQYYVDDRETGDFDENHRFRSNNYLKIDGGFSKFSFGVQVEGYAPQALLNFSPSLNKEIGLGSFYANYKTDKLSITLGHFYTQFGNGLVLRSYEERALGINNSLRGAKVKINPVQALEITGLLGKQRRGFQVSDGTIFGLNTELDISDVLQIKASNVLLGLSYVNRKQAVNHENPQFNDGTNLYSGRVDLYDNGFYSNLEFIHKSSDALVEFDLVRTANLSTGQALFFNTGYSKKGFGLNATFRRLENMDFFSDREAEGNIYNEQRINYIPALTKQHDYSLANIYLYQAQSRLRFIPFGKVGEIGTQIDLFLNLKKGSVLGGKYGMKVALNYATWYGLDADFNVVDRTYSAKYLSFGNKYFQDLNLELRKKWSKKWSSILTVMDLFYSKKYIEETTGKVDATIVMAESTYKITPLKSIRIEGQHLWTDDDRKNWWGAMLEMNFSPRFSLFASDLYNYGTDLGKIHYYNFGGSFTKGTTRIALNYGRQRGGLVCVGGICRIVPESTGIGLTFNTSF